jgi:TolA-binding protein
MLGIARLQGSWLLVVALLATGAMSAEPESSAEAKAVYADAANFQNNGAFDLAVDEWQKFLKDFPKDPLAPKAQHYLGVCLMQQKKFPEAIAAFDVVRKEYPKFELLEDSLLNLGWSQYQLASKGDAAQFPQAAATFTEQIDKFPKGKLVDQAFYFLGEANYQQGKKAEAVAAYERLVKEQEKSSLRCDALYALGVAQEELSHFPQAGEAYDAYLKECGKSDLAAEVRMRKAETQLQAGDYAAAVTGFAEAAAVKDFPLADHALYRQAFCLAKLDKFAEAGDLYAKVAQSFPDSPRVNAAEAALAAGRAYYRAEKLDDAANWFNRALTAGGASAPESAHWLARIYLRRKEPAKAEQLAAQHLKAAADGKFAAALKMDQADAVYETDRRADSVALYAKIAAEHPQDELAPQALYNAAFACLELKQFEQGSKFAADFVKTYPQDKLLPDVQYVSAECLMQQGKPAEAEAIYKQLVAQHAQHAEVDTWRIRYGLSLFLQKKYGDVVALLTPLAASLKTAEQQAEAQYLIGVSDFYADKFAEAETALAASLKAAPQWRQADETLLVLSRTERKLNKNKEAVATVEKLIAEFPQSKLLDQAHYRLGEYRYAADEFKPAAAEYETVVAKYPQSTFVPYAFYGLGWCHLKQKEFAKASQAFTSLLDKHPNHSLVPETLFARATSRRNEGNFQGAIDDAAGFAKTNPAGDLAADALYEKGLAEVGLKQYPAAVQTFESILTAQPKYAGADKVLYELGWAQKSQNKNMEALAAFARLANEYQDSPLAAEAYFHVAEDQYDKKQYADAAKTYALAKSKASAGELSEKATYKLGWSYFQQKEFDAAGKQFTEQVEKFGEGPLASDARFMKAECLFRQNKYDQAYPAFQDSVAHPASTPAMAVLSLLHGGQSASQLKQYDAALKLFSEISTKFSESPYLAEAQYETAWALQNSGKSAEAAKSYLSAAEKSRSEVGARARFMLGELLFEQKSYPEAVKEFQRAMYGYGGEAAAAETKNWQAKSGYEAGRCAEVQIAAASEPAAKSKFIADAKKFYGYVAEKHANHELAGEAKKRLEALAKL